MYLCRAIRWQGRRYEMVGIIPAEVELSTRPAGHGYVEAGVAGDNPGSRRALPCMATSFTIHGWFRLGPSTSPNASRGPRH